MCSCPQRLNYSNEAAANDASVQLTTLPFEPHFVPSASERGQRSRALREGLRLYQASEWEPVQISDDSAEDVRDVFPSHSGAIQVPSE